MYFSICNLIITVSLLLLKPESPKEKIQKRLNESIKKVVSVSNEESLPNYRGWPLI